MAFMTRARVDGFTSPVSLTTRDTVAVETFARLATSSRFNAGVRGIESLDDYRHSLLYCKGIVCHVQRSTAWEKRRLHDSKHTNKTRAK
jgi:hypothetical protein